MVPNQSARVNQTSGGGEDEPTVVNFEPGAFLQLLDEVETLEKRIGAGDMTKKQLLRVRIDEARAAVGSGTAQFDEARWSSLDADRLNELFTRLIELRDELNNGRNTRTTLSHRDSTLGEAISRKSIVWLAIFVFIFAATLLSLLR